MLIFCLRFKKIKLVVGICLLMLSSAKIFNAFKKLILNNNFNIFTIAFVTIVKAIDIGFHLKPNFPHFFTNF